MRCFVSTALKRSHRQSAALLGTHTGPNLTDDFMFYICSHSPLGCFLPGFRPAHRLNTTLEDLMSAQALLDLSDRRPARRTGSRRAAKRAVDPAHAQRPDRGFPGDLRARCGDRVPARAGRSGPLRHRRRDDRACRRFRDRARRRSLPGRCGERRGPAQPSSARGSDPQHRCRRWTALHDRNGCEHPGRAALHHHAPHHGLQAHARHRRRPGAHPASARRGRRHAAGGLRERRR